jgi:HEAT repeats
MSVEAYSVDLIAFAHDLEQRLSSADPNAFEDCIDPLQRVLQSGLAYPLVERFLASLDTPEVARWQDGSDAELLLARGDHFSLAMRPLDQISMVLNDDVLLEGLGHHVAFGVAGPGTVEIERYRLPPPHSFEVLDRGRRLERPERDRLEHHHVRLFRAGQDVFRVVTASNPTVVVLLKSKIIHRVRWMYRATTLAPALAVAVDPQSSRLEFACRVLAEMGDESVASSMTHLMNHPDHFVRWAAVRSTSSLDWRLGRELLRTAAQDAHPHVRAAASRMLAEREEI